MSKNKIYEDAYYRCCRLMELQEKRVLSHIRIGIWTYSKAIEQYQRANTLSYSFLMKINKP